MDKNLTEDLMQMLNVNETIDQMAKANSFCWYGHALREDKNNLLRKSLDFRVMGQEKWVYQR